MQLPTAGFDFTGQRGDEYLVDRQPNVVAVAFVGKIIYGTALRAPVAPVVETGACTVSLGRGPVISRCIFASEMILMPFARIDDMIGDRPGPWGHSA